MNFLQQNASLNLDIEKTARRLIQRKQTIAETKARLVAGICTQLTSPASFCFAGIIGYVVGDFSQCWRARTLPGNQQAGESNFSSSFKHLVKLFLNAKALESLFRRPPDEYLS